MAAATKAAIFALVLAAGLLAPAHAADPVFDAKGFDPNREYASELPFEHVDPMTGNLLLTFTDLVLPGNAGFDLKIQRTYNSKIYASFNNFGAYMLTPEDSWAGLGWSLHLGRVWNPSSTQPGPTIEMSDGSRHASFRHMDFNPSHFITKDYWTYDRSGASPILRLPNGRRYTFGRNVALGGQFVLLVTQIDDSFGNSVTITYAEGAGAPPDAIASIQQRLGTSQVRTVTFAYDATLDSPSGPIAAASLRSMTFLNRSWTYAQQLIPEFGYTLLTGTTPPVGPSWGFEYSSASADTPYVLKGVSTPSGGHIAYIFAPQLFQVGSGAIYTPSLRSRTTSGPDVVPGTWQYRYNSTNWSQPVVSTVDSPCGVRTRYTFKAIGPAGSEQPWAIGAMAERATGDLADQYSEVETLEWQASAPISPDAESGNSFETHLPLVKTRTVVREGHTYRTTYTYNNAAYSGTRASNFNDYGRPTQVDEVGDLTRRTAYTFVYPTQSPADPSFGIYIVDKTNSETMTVAGESFARSWTYDMTTGFRTSETNYGVTTLFRPTTDGRGNVREVEDGNAKVTRYVYDWAQPNLIQAPQYSITRVINPEGTLKSETRRGFTTRFEYDDLFRVVKVTPPLGNPTITEYDNAQGRFVRVRRGLSAMTSNLDGLGLAIGTSNTVGVRTRAAYDACGRRTYESYPFLTTDIGTTSEYDVLGRVKRKVNPDQSDARFAFDGIDVTITDENHHQTTQDWSAFGSPAQGRLVSVTDADSQTTRYSYNALGALTRVEPPAGAAVRTWHYNPKNQLDRETQPENGTTTYTYDNAGNLKTRTDAQFGMTQLTYDGNNRLTNVDRPGSDNDTKIAYDDSDNRTLLAQGPFASPTITAQFGYDAANRLTSRGDVVGPQSFTTGYQYDDNGNLIRLDYPSGRAAVYTYDNENRITSVSNGGTTAFATGFTYHPSGAPTAFHTGNGLFHQLDYDNRYRLAAITSGSQLHLGYSYDFVGNVKTITDARPAFRQTLDYDTLDRLKTASGAWGTAGFTYDVMGNRRSKTIGSATTTYGYTPATNRLTTLSGAEAMSIAYDANGNTVGSSGATVTYGSDNMMATSTVGGLTTYYGYDGDQLRKGKATGTEARFFIHGPGNQILSEFRMTLPSGPKENVRDYIYAGTRLLAAVKPTELEVSPTALSMAAIARGAAPPQQVLKIETPGSPGTTWTATGNAPWVVLSSATGTTPANLSVTIDPTRLPTPGNYSATISVTAQGVIGSPKVVTLSVVIVDRPELLVNPRTLSFTASVAPGGSAALAGSGISVADAYGRLPLAFEENRGQAPEGVRFLSRGRGYGLFLASDGLTLRLSKGAPTAKAVPGRNPAPERQATLRMRFEGAQATEPRGIEPLPGRSHYYRGRDPKDWVSDAPQVARVLYPGLYLGVDLVLYGSQRELEYDLVVAPGADPRTVRLRFDGADSLRVDDAGNLVVKVGNEEIRQLRPFVYQEVDGVRTAVEARYALNSAHEVGFQIAEYDRARPLVVDPVLSYATFLGGSGPDGAAAIAVDAFGNVYVGGTTASADFPTVAAQDATFAGGVPNISGLFVGIDAFVAKIDPQGQRLVYSTYLGGVGNDGIGAIAVDALGQVYATGATTSPDFPVSEGAFQQTFGSGPPPSEPNGNDGGDYDAFVVKLNQTGGMAYSTYLGGYGADSGMGIATDPQGNAYVMGQTSASNFPFQARLDPTQPYGAFVAKLNSQGSALTYSTLLGSVAAWGMALDASGSVLVTGDVYGPVLPVVNALQSQPGGQPSPIVLSDAFVMKLAPSGLSLAFSTYLGGSDSDHAQAVAVGPQGDVYVLGSTASTDFPTRNPLQPSLARIPDRVLQSDLFVTRINPTGSALVYSTYLGGSQSAEEPRAITVDRSDNVLITGHTSICCYLDAVDDFPLVNPIAPIPTNGGDFLTKINASGSALLFSTGLGFSPAAVATDGMGGIYVAGSGASNSIATAGVLQPALNGDSDAFVAKLVDTQGLGILAQGLQVKDKVLATGPAWNATANVSWLSLSSSSGTGPSNVIAIADARALAPGSYAGNITFSADAKSSPQAVAVTLSVNAQTVPTATANAGGPYFGVTSESVTFNGTASRDPLGSIATYTWDFGDGSSSTGARPQHVYSAPGVYTVRLSVKGYSGAPGTTTTTATINRPPIVNAGPDLVITVPVLTATLNGSAQDDDGFPVGGVLTVQWGKLDGPGNVSFGQPTQPVSTVTFDQPGVYLLALSANDGNVTSADSVTVIVNRPPVARAGGPYVGAPGQPIAVDGRASFDSDGAIASYAWDFGDGATGAGATPQHSYVTGTYTATLTVADNFGATSTATATVTVGSLFVAPTELRFRTFLGDTSTPPQALSISAPGGLALSWNTSVSAPWLSVVPTNGTTPSTVNVGVDLAGLAEGAYSGSVAISPAAGFGDPVQVPVDLAVQPPAGEPCGSDSWYCEPFDALVAGNVSGQANWVSQPGGTAEGQVVTDPRPSGTGLALRLDPPVGASIADEVDFADLPADGAEVSLQVMAHDTQAGGPAAKLALLTAAGQGWGADGRTFGLLEIGSSLAFRRAATQVDTLVASMESQRWYQVTIRYEAGQVSVFVDAKLAFTAASGLQPGLVIQGLSVAAANVAGGVFLDVLQVRPLAGADLLVQPNTLVFEAPQNGQCPSIGQLAASAAKASRPVPSRKREDPPSLLFEANVGQADPGADFVARGRGYAFLLNRKEAVLALGGVPQPDRSKRTTAAVDSRSPAATLRMTFVGASEKAQVEPLRPASGRSNYLVGSDPTRWHTNVPQYGAVRQRSIYPGIDLEFYGSEGRLEHDWIVAPGADPTRIAFTLEGVRALRVDTDGDLVVDTPAGDLRFRKPQAHVGTTPAGRPVTASYRLAANGRVGFELGAYDRRQPLVIDPVLVYSSVLAGSAYSTAVDVSGNVYLTGLTTVPQPPTTPGAVLGATGVGDAFVTKLAPDGQSVIYTTYFGGSGLDAGYAVAVDANHQAVVAGVTQSTDFPTANAIGGSFGGGAADGFVAKLTADGTGFVYSTYLGGAKDDRAWGLAVDSAGAAYVTGQTYSADFPVSAESGTPLQATLNNGSSICTLCGDGFVTKLNASGGLTYSTYFGGSWTEEGTAAVVDSLGQVYITGDSQSPDLIFVDPANTNTVPRAFVLELNASGTSRLRAQWLHGTTSWSYGNAIAIDLAGAAYVAGTTLSPQDLPTTPGAFQTLYGGGSHDGFVTKIDDQGVVYSSFLGGSGDDTAEAIAVDASGRAYVVGTTASADYPLTSCLRGYAGKRDAFVTRLSPVGDAAEYSTFFGGSGDDDGLAVAFAPGGDVVVAGGTNSDDLPVLGSMSSLGGTFVARVSGSVAASAGTIGFMTNQQQVNESAGSVSVDVVRQCGTQGAASVQFNTIGGTALPGVNYSETEGSLSFAGGEAGPKTITVPILDDGFITCGGLKFQVMLGTATGAGVSLRSTAVLIHDSDQGHTVFRRPFEIKDRALATGPQWQATVGADSPWLTLSSYAGTGPSQVDAIVNISGLTTDPPNWGQYIGIVTVTAPGAANSPQQIEVDLLIEPGGAGAPMAHVTSKVLSTAKKGGRQ